MMNEFPIFHSLAGLERALEVQSILAIVAALAIAAFLVSKKWNT